MHKFKIEATKFTIVGAVNFALTFNVFTVMLKVLGVNYLLSLVAAWVVGMLFSDVYKRQEYSRVLDERMHQRYESAGDEKDILGGGERQYTSY